MKRLVDIFFLSLALLLICAACGGKEAKAPEKPESASSERAVETVSIAAPDSELVDLEVLDTAKVKEATEELSPKAVKPTKRAKAIAQGAVYDFGFIDEGDKIEHTFTIRNGGNATLRIDDVDSSCGCTVAEMSAWSVAPGKSTQVKTVFDSLNKFGKQRKTVTISTNVGKVELALVGVVRPKGFQKDTASK
jgi:hypothetical protein